MLFIVQAIIILCVCRAMHFPLGYLHQPRVVGEVLGGIILGPSVIGRIPNFSATVFPKDSIPVLNNVANLGLILFLFIIGLEVDMRVFFGNWKIALSVAAAGMTFPFALGAAVAHGLYHQFSDEPGTKPIAYGTFVSLFRRRMTVILLTFLVAFHWRRDVYHCMSLSCSASAKTVLNQTGVPSALSYLDRTETTELPGWHHHPSFWCW
jgi:Kef-type K+ transport system membrane component KefB